MIGDQVVNRPSRWAIFCKVIDNYGDAGVCWRLAQQLAGQYGFAVDLYIDLAGVIERFGQYWQYAETGQCLRPAIRVLPWPDLPSTIEPCSPPLGAPDYAMIVAAFAVELPASWQTQMSGRRSGTWFNLEYLSAEVWVADFHLRTSIKPMSTACETFYFPGFGQGTGGLLREPWMPVKHIEAKSPRNHLCISVFCYANAPLQQLLNRLEGNKVTVKLAASGWDYEVTLPNHSTITLECLPFLSQNDYDQLLAACDLNFVRGEDSLVRAIWAGRPFVWQIYRQADNAHATKLAALLDIWSTGACAPLRQVVTGIHAWWNELDASEVQINGLIEQLPAWQTHAIERCDALSQEPEIGRAHV